MDLHIRDVSIEDLNWIYSIELNTHVTPWSRNILKECILVGYDFKVLEIIDTPHKTLVGYIIIRNTHRMAHILNLCITPIMQSQGMGRKLLQYCIDLYETTLKADEMMLEVRPSNVKAMQLYESVGFELIEIKENYYHHDDGFENAIVLKKRLGKRKGKRF